MSNPITAADLAEALRELSESLDDLDAGAKHYDAWGSSALTVRALNRHAPARANAKAILTRFDAQQAEARKPVECPHEPVTPTRPRDESMDVWVFGSLEYDNEKSAIPYAHYVERHSDDLPGERYVPYSQLEAEQADVARLKAALNRDRTGLAAALVRVKELCAGYSWIPDGEWGSYDYTQQTKETLRKEVGNCLDAVCDIAMSALKESGDVATRAIRNEPSDSELLDAILEAFNPPAGSGLTTAILAAIAERAKR